MLKFRTVVIILFSIASIALAAPASPQFEEWELVAQLCGRLEQIDRIPDKTIPGKYTDKYRPIKDARMLVYERLTGSRCCGGVPLSGETKTDKSGNFEFKKLASGNYWLVANYELQQYAISVRVQKLKDKQPVCSQLSFVVDESGEFVLRVRAPGR